MNYSEWFEDISSRVPPDQQTTMTAADWERGAREGEAYWRAEQARRARPHRWRDAWEAVCRYFSTLWRALCGERPYED